VLLTIVGKVFVVPLVVLMMVVLVEDSLQSEERTKSQMIEDGITTNSDVPSTCIHVLYTGLHAGRGPGEGRELTMGKESKSLACKRRVDCLGTRIVVIAMPTRQVERQ
jgi:hypothetical protein